MLEIFEAVSFLKCLEIWSKNDLLVDFVNEEKSRYRGIDFIVTSTTSKNMHHAFQLLEYKSRYSPLKNTKEFAQWIIGKKFNKGDKKIHLLVNISMSKDTSLNIPLLTEMLKKSPFRSIVLFFHIKSISSNNSYGIFFVSGFDTRAVIELQKELITENTGDCPLFDSKDTQNQRL